MADGEISVRLDDVGGGRAATVTINRAARANSLSTAVVTAMRDAFLELREDADLRIAVLTGAGDRSFIGGANLHELKAFTPELARRYLSLLSEANTAIRDLPVPVVARINGACIGAGLEVAAACDVRIAADSARLGMPEVVLDLPSVVEAALFPRLMGWGRTAWLLYRGDLVDADQAERWGLVERVVPAAELNAAVEEFVSCVAANGPTGIRAQKALMRQWEAVSLSDGIRAGIDSIGEAVRTGRSGELIRGRLNDMKSAK